MTTAPEMKIGALAPWFGAKRTMAPIIVKELGEHRAYWEPFCGSMAVLMGKPPSRMETVNDLHGDLINLARVIKDRKLGTEFYRRARREVCADESLSDADVLVRAGDFDGQGPDVDRALAFWVTSWMGRNGEVGLAKQDRGRTLSVRWTPNGGDPATRYGSAVASLVAFRLRLRDVTILRRDAFEVIDKIGDDDGTVLYVDPPYLMKSDRYLYDFNDGFMAQANDHERLAAGLSRFKRARVVVSYYEHPALASLYPKWTRRPVAMNKAMGNVSRRGASDAIAREVLLINAPSLAGS